MKKRQYIEGKYDKLVLEAIDDFWIENCYPPTIRDLMGVCDIPSTSHVSRIIRKLQAQGYLVPATKRARPVPIWIYWCVAENTLETMEKGART